ncbi:MAG TPA: hypothetical protein VFZ98_02665 [Vicinamibacterales bacterium]
MMLLVAAVILQAAGDPLAGTWAANLDKSQRDPNHQFTELTMRFEVTPDAVTLIYSGVNRAGHREASNVVLHPDGKEYPVSQAPGIMMVATRTERRIETIARRDGAVVGRGAYEVSADGKTLTATLSGADASGKPFQQVIVFDRR